LFVLRNDINGFLNAIETFFQIVNHGFSLQKIFLTIFHDNLGLQKQGPDIKLVHLAISLKVVVHEFFGELLAFLDPNGSLSEADHRFIGETHQRLPNILLKDLLTLINAVLSILSIVEVLLNMLQVVLGIPQILFDTELFCH
jgi:hypothetical protein